MAAALADRVDRLQVRLDALKRGNAASAPGQLGLDLSASAAAPVGKGKAAGLPCGAGHISPAKQCRIGKGEAPAAAAPRKPVPAPASDTFTSDEAIALQVMANKTIKSDKARRAEMVRLGVNPDADFVELTGSAREKLGGKDWWKDPSGYKEKLQRFAAAATASSAAHTPRRFGATPKARKPEEEMLTSGQVLSGASQEKFAKQQRAAAWRAGDKKGEKAWAEQQAEIQRRRLAASRSKLGMSQQGLFGVTEYSSDMPLFGRTDAAQSSYLVQRVVAGVLPGAQVLDWDQQRGITSGRAAAEGLVYRFRCDADQVAFSPAWDGLTEESWENRSTGFLGLRDPSMRLDFKKLRFGQTKSKRKCAKGYSCGSACISLVKECRITPRDSLSKQRLRQLRALAMSGDPAAKQRAAGVEQARGQQAGALREQRDMGRLRKLMARPEMAEYLRTGKLQATGGPAAADGDNLAGKVKVIDPRTVEVDAERFQYKIAHSSTGEVGSLKGVKKWDDNLAGVISVWQDPKDSKTYVINGHNRLGLAKRMGVDEVTVRYLKAGSAQEARAIGAMQNIAEGQGSELDAAKFFRDSGIRDQAGVEEKGLPLSSGKAAKGLALSKLPAEMFQEVIQGDITPARGAIIGGSGLDEGKQREIGKLLRQRKNLSDGTLQEYVENLAVSQRQTQGTLDLLGAGEESVDNGLARAELSNGLRRKLAKEKSLFATVSKSRAAEALQQKAGNVINQSESADVASEADQVLKVFKQLKDQSGPVANALNKAATRVTKGESAAAVRKELEQEVIAAMQEELERAGLRKKKASTNEAPSGSLFDSLTLEARIAQLAQRLDAGQGQPCGNSHIPADATCHQGKGGQVDDIDALTAEVEALLASSSEQDRATEELLNNTGSARVRIADKRLQVAQGKRELDVQERYQRRLGRTISAMEREARGDSLEARIARLDARLDGPKRCTVGISCGSTCISKAKECRVKGDPATMAKIKSLVRSAVFYEDKAGKIFEVSLSGEGKHEKVWAEVKAKEQPLKATASKLAEKAIAIAKELGVDPRIVGEKSKQALITTDLSFAVGDNRSSLGYGKMDLSPADGALLAREIFRQTRDFLKNAEDGSVLTCTAFNGDGYGPKRKKMYEALGFQFLPRTSTAVAVVKDGKIAKPHSKRIDAEDTPEETAFIEAALELPEFGGGNARRDADAHSIEDRLARLDARIKQAPGQLGFDLTGGGGEPAGKGKAPGVPCGESHISAAKECRKGEGGGGAPPEKPQAAAAESAGPSAPAGTPRGEAERAAKDGDPDYEFARASAVGNVGEDLKGSARHIRNQWRTLAEAEADGTAADLVTRDKLLKAEPLDLSEGLTNANYLTRLAGHLALKSFPAQPYTEKAFQVYRRGRVGETKKTPAEMRKLYYDHLQEVKGIIDKRRDDADPRDLLSEISKATINRIAAIRGDRSQDTSDRYNPLANSLVDLSKKASRGGYAKSSITGQMNTLGVRLKRANDGKSTAELAEVMRNATKEVLDGASIDKVTGVQRGGVTFNPADLYVKTAKRTGGRSLGVDDTPAGSTTVLANRMGMRGLQFGNSVTDDERAHHLRKTAEALVDLADVTGLPDRAISLDGQLGLAFGARGKGRAAAHYEPGNKVINITRKNGVGTLAHEWGHALDDYIGVQSPRGQAYAAKAGDNYLSEQASPEFFNRDKMGSSSQKDDPVWGAMDGVRKAIAQTDYMQTLRQGLRDAGIRSGAQYSYWTSGREVFARTFERYVQHKLQSKGQENTYLSGLGGDSPLWPSKQQIAEMAPAFDELMKAVSSNTFGSMKRRSDSREQRVARFMGEVEAASACGGSLEARLQALQKRLTPAGGGRSDADSERDYRKEYDEFHGKPEQIRRRIARGKARRLMGLKKGDPREVDHKKPLSKGGSNEKENLRVVSRSVNREKGAAT